MFRDSRHKQDRGMRAAHAPAMLLVSALLALLTLSPLDYETALELRVAGVVKQSGWRGSWSYLGGGWFEFRTENGPVFRKFAGDTRTFGGKQPKKMQVIDVRTVDTTGFSSTFKSMGALPIGSTYNPMIGLCGRSGALYFCGIQWLPAGYSGTIVLESSYPLDSCRMLFRYAEPFVPIAPSRFKSSHLPHLTGDYAGRSFVFYTLDTVDYPTAFLTTRDGKNSGAQTPRLADFDQDGFDEILIVNDIELSNPRVHVSGYDTVRKVFVDTYRSEYKQTAIYGSFAVDDFDRDEHMEFAFSAVGGLVFLLEYKGHDTLYPVTMMDTTRMVNAGWNCEGNDVDGDGRREIFIGSEYFGGESNIAVYEATGDNEYEVSLWLEIRGISALRHGMTAGDVDGDGREELLVYIGGMAMVFKAESDDTYTLFWMKGFRSEISITLLDINNDGAEEVLIGMFTDGPVGITEVYAFDKSTSILPMHNHNCEISFTSIYPCPARDAIHGNVRLPRGVAATLILRDISGRAVSVLSFDVNSDTETFFTFPSANIPQACII